MLTIFELGGIGKTELALAAAKEQEDNFRNGSVTAMLASIQSTVILPSSLIDAFSIPLYGENDPLTGAINFLREKQLLLVLDNFEHLLDSADVISRILASAPEVKILVTSCERLKLTDEWILDLQGLAYPGVDQVVSESYGAVELFCHYVRRPGFSLNDQAAHIGVICRQVRGMPLAIEMAASWLRYESFQQIAERIGQYGLALTSTNRDVPSRHRSIKAVFDQSWRLLTEAEARAMMMLSVFVGRFGADAALQVANVPYQMLLALVDKALLSRAEKGQFEMHPLIRQYATDNLIEARLEADAKGRHLNYFLKYSADFSLDGLDADQILCLNRFDQSIDDFRAATAWSHSERANVKAGLQIAVNLYFVLQLGRIPEAKYWLIEMASVVEDLKEDPLYAKCLWTMGGTAWFTGDNETAYNYVQKAIDVHFAFGGTQDISYANYLGSRGWVQKTLLMFQEAEQSFRESADLIRSLGIKNTSLYCYARAS